MTRRRLALLVAAALAVAALGLLARPLLSASLSAPARPTSPPHTTPTAAPADVLAVAARAAINTVCVRTACRPATVDRTQGYCPTLARCVVTLLTSRAAAGLLVPVALSVTVTRGTGGGWQVVEVRS